MSAPPAVVGAKIEFTFVDDFNPVMEIASRLREMMERLMVHVGLRVASCRDEGRNRDKKPMGAG